jgi:hypothetical protein
MTKSNIMERSELNKKMLIDASRNAQKAIDAFRAPKFSEVPPNEKTAWAMAAMIHCDVCRLVVAYDECESEGIARLLWMAEIASKLHEANKWYFKTGGKLLQDIAATKKCGAEVVRKQIKDIKTKYAIVQKMDAYSVYRNKFGYHYDAEALDYLEMFRNEDANTFFERLKTFVQFSGEWAQLTKSLIQDDFA